RLGGKREPRRPEGEPREHQRADEELQHGDHAKVSTYRSCRRHIADRIRSGPSGCSRPSTCSVPCTTSRTSSSLSGTPWARAARAAAQVHTYTSPSRSAPGGRRAKASTSVGRSWPL